MVLILECTFVVIRVNPTIRVRSIIIDNTVFSFLFVFQVIKDYQLMAVVCVLVGFDVLVLTIWEFLDPLQITFYNKTLEQMVGRHDL